MTKKRNTITHVWDQDYWKQMVTPELLREILDVNGAPYERPADLTDVDEWDVAGVEEKRWDTEDE